MEKLLVYPFDETFLPILRLGALSPDKQIRSIVSLPGWGLVGNKYSSNDGRILTVTADFETEFENCDALWIVNSQDTTDEDDDIKKKIDYAVLHNKNVYFTRNKTESLEHVTFSRESHSELVHDYACSCEVNLDEIRTINTPVVIIADLYGGINNVCLELSIRKRLVEEGYRVLNISDDKTTLLVGCITYPDELFSGEFDTKEKILMVNNYLVQKELLYKPDVIVATIPNGILNCSPKCLDQFGYYAFVISKSLCADIGVLRVPFNYYSEMELDSLTKHISNTFDIETDFLYFTNKYLLAEDSEIYGYPRYMNLSDSYIAENRIEKVKQCIYYYTEEKELTKEIEKKLNSYTKDTCCMRLHKDRLNYDMCKNRDFEEKLAEIFLNRTGIDFLENTELKKMNFFGSQLNIQVRELALTYLDICNIFNMVIPETFILEGKYTTFENVLNLLK